MTATDIEAAFQQAIQEDIEDMDEASDCRQCGEAFWPGGGHPLLCTACVNADAEDRRHLRERFAGIALNALLINPNGPLHAAAFAMGMARQCVAIAEAMVIELRGHASV